MGANFTDLYGVPYDYKSVMHYSEYAFAENNSKPTIVTKDHTFQSVIGMAREASEGDYKKICGIYGCSKCVGRPFLRVPSEDDDGDDNDDEEEEQARRSHCEQCEPQIDCNKAYGRELKFKRYFEKFCCGNCGKDWWKKWCENQSVGDKIMWRNKGLC